MHNAYHRCEMTSLLHALVDSPSIRNALEEFGNYRRGEREDEHVWVVRTLTIDNSFSPPSPSCTSSDPSHSSLHPSSKHASQTQHQVLGLDSPA
jgi:hypothetical protein